MRVEPVVWFFSTRFLAAGLGAEVQPLSPEVLQHCKELVLGIVW